MHDTKYRSPRFTARTQPDSAPAAPQAALVRTCGDRRTLEFRPGMIQSEMRLSRPDELVLRYARAMMCFTLFTPQPRHIVMVGLGGGSLVKFCHRYLPQTRITVLELRADVIALRAQFLIPPDDARLRVIHADASAYLKHMTGSADVLLVDGFDEGGMPPALGSAGFYADCRRALRPGGVLVANIFSYDRHYDAILGRLKRAFADHVCCFDDIAGNNRILFASNGGRAQWVRRLVALRGVLGLHFLNRLLAQRVVDRLSHERRAG